MKTDNRDSAQLVRTVTEPAPGSKLYGFKEDFVTNKPFLASQILDPRSVQFDGECTVFYPTGQKLFVAVFNKGEIKTETDYFPNGVVYLVKKYPNPYMPSDFLIISSNDSTGKALITNGNGRFINYMPKIEGKFSNLYNNILDLPITEADIKNGKRADAWQGSITNPQSEQRTFYIKDNGYYVLNTDSMNYTRVINDPDVSSNRYKVFEYYRGGQKKMIAEASDLDGITLDGQCVSYWPNGHIKQVATYEDGKLLGKVYDYYSNGKLHAEMSYSLSDTDKLPGKTQQPIYQTCIDSTGKQTLVEGEGHYIGYANNYGEVDEEGNVKAGQRTGIWTGHYAGLSFTETYENNHLISGKATDIKGAYTYNQRFVYPEFKGGLDAFYAFIGRNTQYPPRAREENIQGKVVIAFKISREGSAKDIVILSCPRADLGQEAANVISYTKNWLPALHFGREEDSQYVVPITFTIADRYR